MQKRKKIWLLIWICGLICLGVAGCEKRQTQETETALETESATEPQESIFEKGESDSAGPESAETLAIEDDGEETETESEAADPLIVVLDPGHDSEYCTRNHPSLGVNEQDLNLAIALACRDRLEQYAGIAVYMTREDGSCPDAQHQGEYCIEARTGYATELGADLFVSFHNNGSTGKYGASANGTEVYVSNYSAYTEEGRKLGQLILDGLAALDLEPKGVFVRTKEAKGYYDDGSVQDWYYLISYSVEGGHPGVIIEHAFMDNAHDNAILKDEENLIAMGISDADAIAAYYGLALKQP